ncbi:Pao retrotransposon peptidase superfamily [Trichinella spiralis]|uniref:Pao retrotransposon peptidase superfamily n=1 Tax=Trichinella spiralis TaxID=6334 RepID=UPI0001EFEF0E|nr:Pao retrotransposon peptidase superfamily [Trichinella spiralis]
MKRRVNDMITEIQHRCAENVEIEKIEAMVAEMDRIYSLAEDLQWSYEELLNEDDLATKVHEWNAFHYAVVDTRATFHVYKEKIMKSSKTESAERKAAFEEGKEPCNLRIPKWQLTPFDGDIMQFGAFWDQFQASVHSRTDLNDIEKFICLRSNLKGPALDVISGFSITATNYPEAVKTALRAMGKDPINGQLTTAEIFLALTQRAMPSELNKKWEEFIESDTSTPANLESFLEFVRKQIDIEEKVTFTKGTKFTSVEKCPTTLHENRSKGRPGKYTTAALQIRTQERSRCLLCQKFHDISVCTQFLASDVDERWRIAKRLGLCHSCLKKGHRKIECGVGRKTATGETSIHDLLNRKDAGDKKIDDKPEENITKVRLKMNVDKKDGSSSYSNGKNEIKRTVNCILDSGAQRSFVKREVVESLGLNGPKEHITISGFNQRNEHRKLMRVELRLKGVDNDNFCVINSLCVSHLCGKVPPNPPMEEHEHLKGLKLADLFPRGEVEIDLLIGIDHYYDIVLNEIKRVDTSKPTAVKTIFGWVVCGKNIPQNRTHLLHCKVNEECKCECNIIKKFWELEALGTELRNEFEVNDVLERFKNEVRFDGERYVVKLPWKSPEVQVPNNYELAERRLQQLEKRLSNNNERAKEYDEVIKNYMDRGWIEETDESDGIPGKTWYLPHHAVYRDDKTTTRCRIVFDASAKYQGTSLNDFLEPGPPLQNQILDILIRFRRFKIGVKADISKMFLQIRLDPEDKDVSRFLWRNMKDGKKPQIFRFNRVTFGLNCAPFLAMAVLHHHAELNQAEYEEAAENVKRNMYVDDIVLSCEKEEDAIRRIKELRKLMEIGGFDLTKWSSNIPTIMNELPSEKIEEHKQVTTLGMSWNCKNDELSYNISMEIDEKKEYTKREVLSTASRIYDPLGYLTPFIIRAKTLIQELWQRGLHWEDPLPDDLKTTWTRWITEWKKIENVRIPRCLIEIPMKNIIRLELHGFSDASEKAYGGAVYIRMIDIEGKGVIKLIVAKSKVTPLKSVTLPRLELVAALVTAKLISHVKQVIDLNIDRVCCWSDSQITLCWIRNVARTWKPFVKNRVESIHELVKPEDWRYCPTKDNPADVITRGTTLRKLKDNHLWWNGPKWLDDESQWPKERLQRTVTKEIQNIIEEERRPTVIMLNVNVTIPPIFEFEKFGNFEKMLRLTAYCNRFVSNCKTLPERRKLRELTSEEMITAEKYWLKIVQRNEFHDEIQILQKGRPLPKENRLKTLDPFLDEDGLLRVGGRLRLSDLDYEMKYPIILPKKHHVVNLIIDRAHSNTLHAGNTQRFIQALNRFGARRGYPRIIQSDNFSTFKMADRLLKNLFSKPSLDKVQRTMIRHRIEWKFITERAPWNGGYWERLVRSVKNTLKKILGKTTLDEEELTTVLCEIEAKINARPLTFVGDDVKDADALTPFHFLIGRSFVDLPMMSTPTVEEDELPLNRKWRKRQQIILHFWKRWRNEYVTTFVSRSKWMTKRQEPKEGDIVLVKEDNTKRENWSIGRITSVLPGSDGLSRTVEVKTAKGTFTRPAARLYLLEPANTR